MEVVAHPSFLVTSNGRFSIDVTPARPLGHRGEASGPPRRGLWATAAKPLGHPGEALGNPGEGRGPGPVTDGKSPGDPGLRRDEDQSSTLESVVTVH